MDNSKNLIPSQKLQRATTRPASRRVLQTLPRREAQRHALVVLDSRRRNQEIVDGETEANASQRHNQKILRWPG